MFRIFKPHTLYVRIFTNSIEVRSIEKNRQVRMHAEQPFSTDRMLLGEFNIAEELLCSVIREIYGKKWVSPSFQSVVQPMEKLEGGLSAVEIRSLIDLVEHAGSKKVEVYGKTDMLSDDEVNSMFIGR